MTRAEFFKQEFSKIIDESQHRTNIAPYYTSNEVLLCVKNCHGDTVQHIMSIMFAQSETNTTRHIYDVLQIDIVSKQTGMIRQFRIDFADIFDCDSCHTPRGHIEHLVPHIDATSINKPVWAYDDPNKYKILAENIDAVIGAIFYA